MMPLDQGTERRASLMAEARQARPVGLVAHAKKESSTFASPYMYMMACICARVTRAARGMYLCQIARHLERIELNESNGWKQPAIDREQSDESDR
jgi:hypothetical protein